MPLIVWNEGLSVGIDAMDEQHKKWVGIINELDDALLNGRSLESLTKLVKEMEHKAKHENFKKKVQDIKKDLLSGEVVLGTRVMKLIKGWLETHIADEDKIYSKAASNK
ncbi:MAG: Methyl-accepting chemotaxis protein [Deltaproteobacteria bacterium]|nr:Methyl-accepting chemotaxis protein [Deltaproteobacteria bacterium]